MKVILAEKPSVAKDIAAFLGALRRHDGYTEGNGYQVTWAFGHLVELKEPEEYDPALKRWTLASLPFVPDRFELRLRGDADARKQFAVIKRLFRAATGLICATDAGREGELIFRYILTMTGCSNKPAQRLWLSSLTPQAIREAFRSLRPLADYDNLYAAAKCRSEADWIVGLNGTRNYTVRFGNHGLLWSVGRVQTPVLAMIVGRDDEIRTFRPRPFWELFTRYRETQFRFTGDRFFEQQEAESLLAQVRGHDFVVRKVQKKSERSLPPQLYDLTELQRDMNRRFGLSAAATLQSAQSLYESKLITYPRTDSRYLSTDMKKQIPRILQELSAIKPGEIGKLDLDRLTFTGRIVNDKKITDHHAIIPTGTSPGSLTSRDKQVYDAVVTRLIAAFYPPCLKDVTTVDAEANEVPFRAKGVRVTSPGWTELYPRSNRENEEEHDLPQFTVGERGPHEPFVKQGETTPPKHYTENTLLSAMETAGKLVDDEQLREALKERGLGTPATRASIIETLLKRNYIQRHKKQLTATDLGRYLVALVQEPNLKSPELTGDWEARLKKIENGQEAAGAFISDVAEFTGKIIATSDIQRIDESRLGNCPLCGRDVIRGKHAFGCSGWKEGCPFVLSPSHADRELDEKQIRALLQHGVAGPIRSADGPQIVLALLDNGHLVDIPVPTSQQSSERRRQSFGKKTTRRSRRKTASNAKNNGNALGPCPLCGADVVEQKRSFSCAQWRRGCKFTIWKTIAGKRISVSLAKTLLEKKQTAVLKGFKSKSGRAFHARLKLNDGAVEMEFDT
jgi:DNA topoisomerase-3